MRLALLKNGIVQCTFPVSDSDLVVGRDGKCDIVLDDRRASKEHARISHLEGGIVVTDLESSNGTRVNERFVLAQFLRPGDLLRVGWSLFVCLADKPVESPRQERRVGTLVGNLPAQGEVNVPIGRNPVLFGGSREATLRIQAKDVREFQTQVVGIPGGLQATDISGAKPRCVLLRHGESFRVGSVRLTFLADAAKAKDDSDAQPRSRETGEKRVVEPAKQPSTRDTTPDDPGAISVLAQQGELGKALADEAQYAEDAEASPRYKGAPPAFRAGAFQLTAMAGPCSGQVFGLAGKRMTIGRSNQCDVHLNDESVSREHATIERVEGDMVIEDLGSSNGVFVNDRRVRRHPLRTGDKVRIGMSEFLVHL